MPVWRSRSLVGGGEQPAAALPDLAQLTPLVELEEVVESVVLLGIYDGVPHFAFDLSHLDEPAENDLLSAHGEFVDLRQVATVLPPEQSGVLVYARAMMTWHRRARFCGTCGAVTRSIQGGHVRVCTSCERQDFPRTDPAVIMLVHDGDRRCLLGRQQSWPDKVYSTLAGFVEPGETLEAAVAREVEEETAIRVSDARYHASQPWPFPSSIMLGFYARAASEEIEIDPEELETARWFERDELVALAAERRVKFPGRMSIARRLIDDWLAEPELSG